MRVLILLFLLLIVLLLIVSSIRTSIEVEHLTIGLHNVTNKTVDIPSSYPRSARGPCLRKNEDGTVGYGVLVDRWPGQCVSVKEHTNGVLNTKSTKSTKSRSGSESKSELKDLNKTIGLNSEVKNTDSTSCSTVCSIVRNPILLDNKCRSSCSGKGLFEVEECTGVDTGKWKGVCKEGYWRGNKMPAKMVQCHPASSDFNFLCQKKYGRRHGYRKLNKKGCLSGFKWATCSDRYYNGAQVYGDVSPCYPVYEQDKMNQFCLDKNKSGESPKYMVVDYEAYDCPPGYKRSKCGPYKEM